MPVMVRAVGLARMLMVVVRTPFVQVVVRMPGIVRMLVDMGMLVGVGVVVRMGVHLVAMAVLVRMHMFMFMGVAMFMRMAVGRLVGVPVIGLRVGHGLLHHSKVRK